MALQIVAVNDASPGACVDTGLTWNGTTTITSSRIIAGTSATMSGTLAVVGNVAVNTNKFTVAAATGNTVAAGTLAVTGATTLTGAQTLTGATTHAAAVGFGGTIVAAADGAYVLPLTTMVTNVSTNGTDDLDVSMADGVAGQLKVVVLDTDGGKDVVITPAHFGNGGTLTMDAASDYAVFVFDGTEWWAISHSGTIG